MDNNTQPVDTEISTNTVQEQTHKINRKYLLPIAGILALASFAIWYSFWHSSEPLATPTYAIAAEATEGGNVTPANVQTLPQGTSVTYTFTPDPGYKLVEVTIDGAPSIATTSYTFNNITSNHTIAASFIPVHYARKGDYVYFKDAIAPGVDPKTFKVVSDYYGKDRQGIFYADGERIVMADAASFKVLDDAEAYAIDSALVFFASSQIFEADATTFRVLGDQYAADKNNVYSTANVIPGADVATFTVVGNGYAQDKNNIYHLGQLFTLSQEVPLPIGFGYSANGDSVFYNGFKVEGADRATFKPLSSYYAKDKAHVYYQWNILPDADPITFEVIRGDNTNGSPQVARDAHHVYSEFAQVPLNPKTTRIVVGDHFLADEQNVYFTDTLIPDADAKSFTAIGGNFGVDVNGLWSGTSLVATNSTHTGEKSASIYQYLGDLFATDGAAVYRGSDTLPNADPKSFNFISGTYYAYDAQNVYYGSELIAVNSQGLTIFGPGAAFAKTTTEVFHNGIKIEGADPISFTVSEDGYRATDKNRQYDLQEEMFQGDYMDLDIEAFF